MLLANKNNLETEEDILNQREDGCSRGTNKGKEHLHALYEFRLGLPNLVELYSGSGNNLFPL